MVGGVAITAHLIQRFRERVDGEATVEDVIKSMNSTLSSLPSFVDLRNNSLIFIGEWKGKFFSVASKVDNGVVVGVTILDIDKYSWSPEVLAKRKWGNKEDAILQLLIACGYDKSQISAIMCYPIGKVHERINNLRRKVGA